MTTIDVANPTTTTSNNEFNEQQAVPPFHQLPPVVAVPSIPSKKRRMDDSEADVQWVSRGVMNGTSTLAMIPNDDSNTLLWSNSHSESRIQFLTVHFNLLQALYNHESMHAAQDDSLSLLSRKSDDTLNTKRQNTSHESPFTNMETPIWNDTNIWRPIQSFMIHQRELLLQVRQRIEHISNLHQAALECCSPTTPTEVVDNATSSSNPVVVKVVVSSSLKTSSTNDSFRIIANIIGQQSKVIQQQKHLPSIMALQQLLQEVTRRITSLQAIYDAKQFQPPPPPPTYVIKNHNDRDNDEEHDRAKGFKPSSTIYNERSYRTELHYKIQLWSLLAHDLKEVLRS